MAVPDVEEPSFGANSWLVEEMYEQFKADPESVGEAWKEFFADYRSVTETIVPHSAPVTARPVDDQPQLADATPEAPVPEAPVLVTPPAGPAIAAEAPPAATTPAPAPRRSTSRLTSRVRRSRVSAR